LKMVKLLVMKENKSFIILEEYDISDEVIEQAKSLKDIMYRKEKDLILAIEEILDRELTTKEAYVFPESALEYKIRSKIIMNFQGYKGGLVQSAFRVVGVYKTDNGMFDEMAMFVDKKKLDELAGIEPDMAHEVAIMCNDLEFVSQASEDIRNQFSNLSVKEWGEIQPELKMFNEFLGMYFYIMTIFILLALGFGIVNTMLMAILERIKELGMLMAVGMNKFKVFSMIMLESVFLTLTGGAAGIVISTIVVMLLNNTGIDFRALYGEGFADIGFSAIVYPVLGLDNLFGTTVLVIITGIVASIYPARKAIKLNPADAVRTDN